jgi:murein DD-endopeptidase MepM/ murein hydrolase activator NlpD
MSKRYTVVVTDPSSGRSRTMTVRLRPVALLTCAAMAMPVLVGLGAAWKGRSDVAALVGSHQALETENASYRAATADLTGQISSLQAALADLGARSALEPSLARAMDRLPALVKARAMGGGSPTVTTAQAQDAYVQALAGITSPEDTFGVLRTILEGVESRLLAVRSLVDRRNALAAATPSLWPARGWLTSPMGRRQDPVTGAPEFHAGLDIAAETGQPVYATAEGVIRATEYRPGYGNLIVVDHGFGLETRYGHLSEFAAKKDQRVKRGDVIGRVGATGRATGPHLHYEVHANGRLLNP